MTYLELGSFEGLSFATVLHYYLTHPDSVAISIDPFGTNPGFMSGVDMGDYGGRFLDNILPYRGKVIVLPMFSQQAEKYLRQYFGLMGSIDLAFIDGSHDGEMPYLDAEMVYPFLKEGSLLIFDDIQWEGPRLACERIAARYDKTIEKIVGSSQWLVVK